MRENVFVTPVITLQGIDEAIEDLAYRNKGTLKYRLVEAIRSFYADEASIMNIRAVDGDELIKRLWDIGDDARAIKNKRKNLSSIRSSVNKDFKKAYEYHRIFKESADSLYSEENARSITQLTMQFEFDKLQMEKERDAQQKIRRQKLIQNLTFLGLLGLGNIA